MHFLKFHIEIQYHTPELFEDICKRLEQQGVDLKKVSRRHISGVDEFHVRGAEVSNELVKEIGSIPAQEQKKLIMLARKTHDSHKKLKKSVSNLQVKLVEGRSHIEHTDSKIRHLSELQTDIANTTEIKSVQCRYNIHP